MTSKKSFIRWSLISTAFTVVLLILWNTYSFFQTYKEEERNKMEIWAAASNAVNDANLDDTHLELPLLIITKNKTIPIILTNERDSILSMINIEDKIAKDKVESIAFLNKIKSQNSPIEVKVGKEKQYLYYGNSSLLLKLKYYPLVLVSIFIFFTILVLIYYRTNKIITQNRLWTGMAKETAHQIGTPLSSLLGWVEIMKLEEVSPSIVDEVEKDIHRLQIITDRFSKIGSIPQLIAVDIITETKQSIEYLRARTSKQVEINFQAPTYPILVFINKELHSWTIENLIKNAIDAIKGKGIIDILIQGSDQNVHIFVSDNGTGVLKKNYKRIFEPGFTTKKRGWGLGLSLTKRIVEDFQSGKIRILHSEIGKGTTFCITYKKERIVR
ncbi:MAG: sensor histidine kinase [Flavobacteriaceae bacterium]|nr:sensor histidine kinase [Flavobacteriaceae bacterium]